MNTADLISEKLRARYPAAVVTYQISESFNKPDGPLGPNLSWSREVFKTAELVGSVVSNQARWFANEGEPDGTEDIVVPSPNIPVADVTASLDVIQASRTGTAPYLVDGGIQTRFRLTGDQTTYRAYAVAIGRNNLLFPPVEQWHLWLFRIETTPEFPGGQGVGGLLGFNAAAIADVTLPGTLTYTVSGSNHSIAFTHGGPGPTLTIEATDDRHSSGTVNIGVGPVVPEDGSITFIVDNFQATATVPQTAGELLKKYRNDNNLQRWEDYIAHIAGGSLSGHVADDENAFWAAFVP
jgi:hypothetical protein